MLADSRGRPLRFNIAVGQVGDNTMVPALIDRQVADAVLADKARDSPVTAP